MSAKESAGDGFTAEQQEFKTITDFAKSVERADPDELAADLCHQWVVYKNKCRDKHEQSTALATFLCNRLINWRRDRRRRQNRHVAFERWSEDEQAFREIALPERAPEPEDSRLPLERFRETLAPHLRRLWDLRQTRKMSKLGEAKWLHKHRNTIRAWAVQLYAALLAFAKSFAEPLPDTLTAVRAWRRHRRPAQSRVSFLPIPLCFFDRLVHLSLSGIQCRLLLKVLLDSHRRKQSAVPFRCSAMARDLGVHQSGLWRAARHLSQRGFITLTGGHIAVDHQFRRPRESLKWCADNSQR
jgi:hypothetical protein